MNSCLIIFHKIGAAASLKLFAEAKTIFLIDKTVVSESEVLIKEVKYIPEIEQ